MNIYIAILGGIGTLGFLGSAFALLLCWGYYVLQVSVQRTLLPFLGKHAKFNVMCSVLCFMFFTMYVSIYIVCRRIWNF